MNTFTLFQSHIDMAHEYWKKLLEPGDHVIDATCGNGNDTLVLAQCALTPTAGCVTAIDLQESAIFNSQILLKHHLHDKVFQRVDWIQGSHASFPEKIASETIKLIVYNLGYLPGGDKQVTTKSSTTLSSIQSAMPLLCPGGALSITCYPGHPEGAREEIEIVDFLRTLDPKNWNCCHHIWHNRKLSPSLILMQTRV